MGVDLGTRLFYNADYEEKIAEIQRQKEALMNDASYKYSNFGDPDDPQLKEVYREIRNFYKIPPKHESPTRRLRQQMDTAWTQKSFLSQ